MWRREVVRAGTEVTEWSAHRSAVVIAPHPDDESIGCGATIARKRAAGADVRVVVVCDGRSSHPSSAFVTADELADLRAREVVAACRRLGVDPGSIVLLGRPDESVATDGAPVETAVLEVLDRHRPDEVYVPSPLDWHVDHRATHRAAVRALTRHAGRPSVLEYPVWYWTEGPWGRTTGPRDAARRPRSIAEPIRSPRRLRAQLVSTDGYVGQKRSAIAAHKSQTRNLTGEPSWAWLPPAWFAPFLGDWEVFFPASSASR
jgi:LmbE family N-acetylglucosaminyl deacetylase